MTITDPIADILTRIRNGNRVRLKTVDVPSSRLKCELARVLKREGFINDYKRLDDDKQGKLRLYLAYTPEGDGIVTNLKRISKPGRRVWAGMRNIPIVSNGDGIAILSTNLGILTDKECRDKRVGGEVLCYVW